MQEQINYLQKHHKKLHCICNCTLCFLFFHYITYTGFLIEWITLRYWFSGFYSVWNSVRNQHCCLFTRSYNNTCLWAFWIEGDTDVLQEDIFAVLKIKDYTKPFFTHIHSRPSLFSVCLLHTTIHLRRKW